MAKKLGMIEIVTNFYSTASPDAAELITKHAIKMNKQVQALAGNKTTRTRAKKDIDAKAVENG